MIYQPKENNTTSQDRKKIICITQMINNDTNYMLEKNNKCSIFKQKNMRKKQTTKLEKESVLLYGNEAQKKKIYINILFVTT